VKLEQRLEIELSKRTLSNSKRSLKLMDSKIDFVSNDYLGLAHNKSLQNHILAELKTFQEPLGSGGSRLLAGNHFLHENLENKLKQIHKGEACLLFNSGYAANSGFFATVPQKNDVVLYDELIHACIKDGMRLGFADKFSFRHNDLNHLEEKLSKFQDKICFVAVESVYSMDGDFAPLEELVSLCKKYQAYLVVDEAHSTGVFGEKGAGLVCQLNLEEGVFARVHTFGKAIGSHGACVIGSTILREYLINFSRQFIYTTSMPPHQAFSLMKIYEYLEQNYTELQHQIRERIELYRSLVADRKIESFSPIQVVVVPGNENVTKAALFLQEKGFDVRPVKSPTVPKGSERLRICLHNFNSIQEIQYLCQHINQIQKDTL